MPQGISCEPQLQFVVRGIYTGFFSNFSTVVGALDKFDRGQCQSLKVDFEDNSYFTDSSLGPNWWEYYFEPIFVGDAESEYVRRDVTFQYAAYATGVLTRKRCSEIINEYIVVKDFILCEVDLFAKEQEFKNYNMVGVHYRGTDKTKPGSEALPVSYEYMHSIMLGVAAKLPNVKFFIASDDERFIVYLEENSNLNCCQNPQIRSTSEIGMHHMTSISSFNKGKYALIDCLLLSRSDILIRMISNLSDTSEMINPDMKVIVVNDRNCG